MDDFELQRVFHQITATSSPLEALNIYEQYFDLLKDWRIIYAANDDHGGLAPIFPYTFYHLTHYWFAAADIPVANDTPVHYADAIRCNVRRPPRGSLPLLTRRVSA